MVKLKESELKNEGRRGRGMREGMKREKMREGDKGGKE